MSGTGDVDVRLQHPIGTRLADGRTVGLFYVASRPHNFMQVAVLEFFIFSKIEFVRRLVGSVYIFAGAGNPVRTRQQQFKSYNLFVIKSLYLKLTS